MPIGVYRIYLSETWRGAPLRGRLLGVLDALPDFLYRIDSAEAAAAADGPAPSRSELRIAMTHSHVVLLWAGGMAAPGGPLAEEIALARAGFRRPIPVLAVLDPGESAETVRDPRVDRWVEWSASAVACAIQELAEAASRHARHPVRSVELPALAPRGM